MKGITISQYENGRIVEDSSVTGTLGVLRQLGLWRSVLVGLDEARRVHSVAGSDQADRGLPSPSPSISRMNTMVPGSRRGFWRKVTTGSGTLPAFGALPGEARKC